MPPSATGSVPAAGRPAPAPAPPTPLAARAGSGAGLDETMLAMDVVDTLRHAERLVERELEGDARREVGCDGGWWWFEQFGGAEDEPAEAEKGAVELCCQSAGVAGGAEGEAVEEEYGFSVKKGGGSFFERGWFWILI